LIGFPVVLGFHSVERHPLIVEYKNCLAIAFSFEQQDIEVHESEHILANWLKIKINSLLQSETLGKKISATLE